MALTAQQNYLLERLPKLYTLRKVSNDEDEPVAVKKARLVIATYETARDLKLKAENRKIEQSLAKVKEAIYFAAPPDALKAVREFESAMSAKD